MGQQRTAEALFPFESAAGGNPEAGLSDDLYRHRRTLFSPYSVILGRVPFRGVGPQPGEG